MPPRIFVQIASYRDAELQPTLADMYAKASNPERIFAGIIWQALPEDAGLLNTIPWAERIRRVDYDARESKGVCWARHQARKLWQGEEYILQIDSHMRFDPGWDEKLINQLAACPSEKAVLTAYPPAYTPPNDCSKSEIHAMVALQFTPPEEMPTFIGQPLGPNNSIPQPLPTMFCAAGFIFGTSSLIKDLPYDPYLYFYGEEITLAVRLWTKGYDIYHPNENVLYHYYKKAGDPTNRTHWADHAQWGALNHLSVARARHLLGMNISNDPQVLAEIDTYGLGTVRSLEDYERASGLHFKTRIIEDKAKRRMEIPMQGMMLTQNMGMDDSWRNWTYENLARGCDPREIKGILLHAGFPLQVIQGVMGDRCPPDHIPVREAAPTATAAVSVNMNAYLHALSLVTPGVDHRALFEVPLLALGRQKAKVKRFDTPKLQLLTLDDFMTKAECVKLIGIMEKHLRPSTITYGAASYRTSKTSDLSLLNDNFVKEIDLRISEVLGINQIYSEGIQAQKYLVGEEFKEHTDFFEPGTEEFREHASVQGNRTWTFMVYLNDTPKGGGTKFVNLGHTFYPKLGRAVIWNSLNIDGTPNRDTLHWGLPVEEGDKYIITKWFREWGQGDMFTADQWKL